MTTMESGPDQNRIKRVRQACQNCRRKKARCTGERPQCAFCVRLRQECVFSDEDEPPNNAPPGHSNPARGHASQDDLAARTRALETQMGKLTQTIQGLATTVGAFVGPLSKAFNIFNREDDFSLGCEATKAVPYTDLPPIQIIRSAADLYFMYCHNQPYSLFHEASFRNQIETGEMPTHLQFALLASTVRYSSDPFFEDKIASISGYAQQSWKAIAMPWNGIQTDAELSIVQTILLLAIIEYTDGRTQSAWIKVGLAIRLAQDFRLMVEPDSDLGPIQQEERRRVFWSFFLCDKLISCGRERPPAINDHQCKLQLPADDNEWRAGNYCQTPTLDKVTDNAGSTLHLLRPFAITIVMASLLGRCAQYAMGEEEEEMSTGKTLPWDPRSKYSAIHSVMLQFEVELGLNESPSRKITQLLVTKTDGSVDSHLAAPLVMTHALFFLCQCLLYHPFLLKQRLAHVGQKTPQSFLTHTFNSCRSAASSLSGLMDDVKSLGCETITTFYDPFYGYCIMVAGTIHSMFMSVTDPVVVESASSSFESSMQNLKELSHYWKSCGMMHLRLGDFRATSDRYSGVVDPGISEVHLSPDAINDLLECLDYSRISTTPRRQSQNATNRAALSQLSGPVLEGFDNLLALSYNQTMSVLPNDGTLWGQSPKAYDTQFFRDPMTDYYLSTTLPLQSAITSQNGAAPRPSIASTAGNASHFSPTSNSSCTQVSTSSTGSNYSNTQVPSMTDPIQPCRADQQPQNQQPLSDIFTSHSQQLETLSTIPMKRPWYNI